MADREAAGQVVAEAAVGEAAGDGGAEGGGTAGLSPPPHAALRANARIPPAGGGARTQMDALREPTARGVLCLPALSLCFPDSCFLVVVSRTQCRTVDDVLREHQTFLDHCLRECLLTHPDILPVCALFLFSSSSLCLFHIIVRSPSLWQVLTHVLQCCDQLSREMARLLDSSRGSDKALAIAYSDLDASLSADSKRKSGFTATRQRREARAMVCCCCWLSRLDLF